MSKPDIKTDNIWQMRADINDEIVSTLKENILDQSVLEKAFVVFDDHLMTYPTSLVEAHFVSHVVSRRFGVEETQEKNCIAYK